MSVNTGVIAKDPRAKVLLSCGEQMNTKGVGKYLLGRLIYVQMNINWLRVKKSTFCDQ